MAIATVNPTTGETVTTFEAFDDAEVERRLAVADAAFRAYRRTSLDERRALVERLADLLEADVEPLAAR